MMTVPGLTASSPTACSWGRAKINKCVLGMLVRWLWCVSCQVSTLRVACLDVSHRPWILKPCAQLAGRLQSAICYRRDEGGLSDTTSAVSIYIRYRRVYRLCKLEIVY